MPSAPKRLSTRAINWGKRSKGKDGAPEALALAVKTTRYGCNWHGGHGAYSKAAHDVLHKRFGDTAWAAQTPYWFDCVELYDVRPGEQGRHVQEPELGRSRSFRGNADSGKSLNQRQFSGPQPGSKNIP